MKSLEREFDHYMIDMETLGITPTAKILSIALVNFDPFAATEDECYKDSIYLLPSVEHQINRTVDQSILDWWAAQPDTLQPVGNEDLIYVADKAKAFLCNTYKKPMIWAQGADFDIPMFESFVKQYSRSGTFPLKYNSKRDLRTLISLCPHIDWPENLMKHNALEDAKCQARMAWRCMNFILGRTESCYAFI